MKLLFLLDYLYSGESTTIRLARLLANALDQQGCDVHFLCNVDPAEQSALRLPEDAICFCSYRDKISYNLVKSCREHGCSPFETVLKFLRSPAALSNAISTVLFKKSLVENDFRIQIEHACAATPYDAVISVSCPHYTMFALADSHISAKKICYMLDPYHSNATMRYAVNLRREIALYKKIDLSWITDLMFAENLQTPLKKQRKKMHVLPFPGIFKPTCPNHTSSSSICSVQCAYVGNLYPGIRNPDYILALIEKLDENICFSFTGSIEGFAPGYFAHYVARYGTRLSLHEPVCAQGAAQLVQQADILVNIGNAIANQLPSKIFEYISTGKPILNFYKMDDCPSLQYLRKYPYALNVRDGDFTPQTVANINCFCHEMKGKKLSFEAVQALYSENTPLYTAQLAMADLRYLKEQTC